MKISRCGGQKGKGNELEGKLEDERTEHSRGKKKKSLIRDVGPGHGA